MKTLRFIIKSGTNYIIPQRSLHVKQFRFDSFILNEKLTPKHDYLFIHCNYLQSENFRSNLVNESHDVIEYLPLSQYIKWKRIFNDYITTDSIIEGPLIFYLSLDGKTDSEIEFSAILKLICK